MTEQARFVAYCRRRFAEMRAEFLEAHPERSADPVWRLYEGVDYGYLQAPPHKGLCCGPATTTMGSGGDE